MRKINAAQCKSISKPGFYRADDTLYLYVKPSGRKYWVQRIVIDDRRRNLGLGPYPVVTLAEARDLAHDNRRLVRKKVNPMVEKRRAQIPSFEEAADMTYNSLKSTWKSRHTVRTWLQLVQKYAMPKIGSLSVDRITQEDILLILKPIWTEKPETARRVRRRIRAILDWCQEHRYIQDNVADNPFRHALPPQPRVKENFRALDFREVPEAVRQIETGVTTMSARLCIMFAIYTAARSNEAREATWAEIDLGDAIWTIPKERMKSTRPHRVPLSRSALAALEQAKSLRNNSGLLFPSPQNPGNPFSSEFWKKHFKNLGLYEKAVLHGFRTSFRTWAAECTDIDPVVCEMALAHTVGNAVEQAYQRSDLLEKRKRLMQLWDDYLGAGVGTHTSKHVQQGGNDGSV